LLRVVAELDRTDPDWRLERIEAKRKVIPDDKNSAALVRMVRRLFDVQFLRGPNKGKYRNLVMRRGLLGKLNELYPELTAAELEEIFQGRTEGAQSISSIDNSLKDLTPGTPLSPERAATLRMALENAGPALAEARLVTNFPEGRHAVAWTRSMFDTLLPHTDDLRLTSKLLEGDAVLQSHDGRMGQALTAWRALVNTGRSIGDEPLAISQIVRMGTVERAVACLEWMLAERSLSESNLSVVQEMLQEEVRHPTFEIMIRGDRGGIHCLFTALQAGDVEVAKLSREFGHKEQLQIPVGTATRPAHAWILRHLSRLLEIARLPLHEQTQPVAQWEEAVRNAPEAAQKWVEWLAGLGYNFSALGRRCQLNQARLRCAVAALAVERYRLAHDDWPRDLASLVPAFLKEVPNDPYDGRPLRYRRLADGVVLYSPGPDGTDNQGNLDRSAKPLEGTDIGFRLWDAARRRQPAGCGP
jgi:hypothetical protein